MQHRDCWQIQIWLLNERAHARCATVKAIVNIKTLTQAMMMIIRPDDPTCGIDHIIHNNSHLAFDFSNHIHDLAHIMGRSPFIHNSQRCIIELFGECTSSSHTTGIRSNYNQLICRNAFWCQIIQKHWVSIDMIYRNIKVAHTLIWMQIHREYPVHTCMTKCVKPMFKNFLSKKLKSLHVVNHNTITLPQTVNVAGAETLFCESQTDLSLCEYISSMQTKTQENQKPWNTVLTGESTYMTRN